MYLCEFCFDQLTSHVTDVWDGLPTAVCDDCLAPPVHHEAWKSVWHPAAFAQIIQCPPGEASTSVQTGPMRESVDLVDAVCWNVNAPAPRPRFSRELLASVPMPPSVRDALARLAGNDPLPLHPCQYWYAWAVVAAELPPAARLELPGFPFLVTYNVEYAQDFFRRCELPCQDSIPWLTQPHQWRGYERPRVYVYGPYRNHPQWFPINKALRVVHADVIEADGLLNRERV
jgi:hypothetical protein